VQPNVGFKKVAGIMAAFFLVSLFAEIKIFSYLG